MDVCAQCYPTREVENASTDVNTLRNEGRTLLRCAIQNEHKACEDGLIKAGTDVNGKGSACGCSPFITALLEHEVECCAGILKAGAHVNELFGSGFTGVYYAVMYGHLENMIRFLLNSGIKINWYHDKGKNVLESLIHLYPLQRFGFDDLKMHVPVLLFAAGEKIGPGYKSPEHIVELMPEKICRNKIRKRLIDVNPQTNLFLSVRKLGLSDSLVKYLVFNLTLDS